MGNDGGSIPTRRELVKSPTRRATHSQLRDSNAQTQEYHWSTCPLSKRPLASPVVSDSSGRLYNKDSILEWLLRGTEAFGDGEEVLGGRVKSLRDVIQVKFDISKEDGQDKWICPVSRKGLVAGVRAVYLVPCGHAFLESAIKEVKGSEGICLQCGTAYDANNIIPINPVLDEDAQILKNRIKVLSEKGLGHTLKKSSDGKSKKRKKETGGAEKLLKKEETGIKNAATASLTSKVLEDEKMKNKRRKTGMSDNLKSLFSTKEQERASGGNDFMSRGYTIPSKR
ncbi:Rtf2 RING-finger-domain-containing protein [Morchella snyderi]|nr:Rtf2 RING-finger-domain-containing protein [Morchella snyderi]